MREKIKKKQNSNKYVHQFAVFVIMERIDLKNISNIC